MKSIRNFLVIAVTVIAFTSNAEVKNGQLLVEVTGESTLKVSLYSGSDVRFVLRKENGRQLIRYNIKHGDSFSKEFDLHNLPKGNYALEVTKAESQEVWPLFIDREGIHLLNEGHLVRFRPVISQKGDRIAVNWFRNTNERLEVKVYDPSGVEVYTEELKSDQVEHLGKIFDFSQSPSGRYSIVARTKEISVVKSVFID